MEGGGGGPEGEWSRWQFREKEGLVLGFWDPGKEVHVRRPEPPVTGRETVPTSVPVRVDRCDKKVETGTVVVPVDDR